jgi:recombination protein RecA
MAKKAKVNTTKAVVSAKAKSKAVSRASTKITTLDLARKAIQKKYGDVVKPMSEKPLIIDTISTRSLGLDTALGRGGIALGRIYEIYGPPSSGKTTLAMSIIAEAQERSMNCVFVDAEHSADPKLFGSMGVDLTKLTVVDLFTGEDNLMVAEQLMCTSAVDLLVIDSVTSLIPKVAADAALDDNTIALLARLMSKTLLRFVPIAAETNTTIIFINQTRNKIGGYGNPEVTTGGEALPFYATGRIRVSGVGAKANRIADSKGTIIGHKTKFEIIKNKLAAPYTSAVADLIYGVGYDTTGEIIQMATDLGLLARGGSWYSYEGKNIGQGENGVRTFFTENPDVFLVIKKDITDILNLTHFYTAQEDYDKAQLT